ALESASEARTRVAFSRFAASRLLFLRSVEVKSVPTRVAALKSLPESTISFLSHSVQSTPACGAALQLAFASAALHEKARTMATIGKTPDKRRAPRGWAVAAGIPGSRPGLRAFFAILTLPPIMRNCAA